MPRKKMAVTKATAQSRGEKMVIDVTPRIVRSRSPIPFENTKRYKDIVELAETMHEFARTARTGSVRASAVQMFAHQLLLIAHKQYRRVK